MSSLYLGKVGTADGEVYEVHAVTKNLPFRGYSASEIGDIDLYRQIMEARFNLLESGMAIFCTAINMDFERKIEEGAHCEREGTVHIASFDRNGKLICGISCAVDTCETENGTVIGVPLENRWRPNGYPEGASLDEFRQNYLKLNYGKNRTLKPFECAELYRHFRDADDITGIESRLAVYAGACNLLVRDPLKKGITPTWLWVFDAIPPWYNVYRIAGGAVLRELSIRDPPEIKSPYMKGRVHKTPVYYRGEIVSRPVRTPIPKKINGKTEYTLEDIHFLDGLIDMSKLQRAIANYPESLNSMSMEGYSDEDRAKLRAGLTVSLWGTFKDFHPDFDRPLCPLWDFSVGGLNQGSEPIIEI